MDSSGNLTDYSVSLTRDAGEALAAITRTVSVIQEMNPQIAAAAEQQSAVVEEINRSVLKVRDVSEQTAAASEGDGGGQCSTDKAEPGSTNAGR